MKKLHLSEERKRFVSILLVTLIIFSTIAYIATTPRPREQFFQLYVLGSNKRAEKYYPHGDSNISPNTPVNWYMGVTNFMGSVQMILIRVKLGNQTLSPPDEHMVIASDLPVIAEFRRILLNNETWEFPFSWQIVMTESRNGYVYLTLKVNDEESIQIIDVAASNGKNFRIIIELWVLDKDSGHFTFGWSTGNGRSAAWLQLWFSATSTNPP